MNNNKESFLYGRDPSIDRRFRPCPVRKVALFNNDILEESDESTSSGTTVSSGDSNNKNGVNYPDGNSTEVQQAQVFLRLRPLATTFNNNIYNISNNVFKCKPVESIRSVNKDLTEKHYKFSNIFNENIDQSIVYETSTLSSIENEDNITILTYGTSASGKTYTLLGDDENPGIILRAIEHIFTKYQNNICMDPIVKLENSNIKILLDDECELAEQMRNQIFNNELSYELKQNFGNIQEKINKQHKFMIDEVDPNKCIFIWISFAEIYNENIYDLLESIYKNNSYNNNNINSNNNNNNNNANIRPKRKNLKILMNNGCSTIKNLTSIFVKTSCEAYELLKMGLLRLNYAQTKINDNSSRSHCIFFIDVITFTSPNTYTYVSYRFCDLAGSERLKKTENTGNRLKEAQRINTSLLVLGRCLDTLYSNQQKKTNELVPIRDSKLTMLLQTPLLGFEKITMIVNLYPILEFYEENLNVLNFSAIAKQVVFCKPPKVERSRSTRFSKFFEKAYNTSSPRRSNDNSQVNSTKSDTTLLLDEVYRLKTENETLVNEINELRMEKVKQELKIRNSLVDDFEARNKEAKERHQMQMEKVKERKDNEIEKLKTKIKQLEEDLEYYMEKEEEHNPTRSSL